MEPIRCKECNDKACVCSDGGKWAAHCMTCDNCIGKRGTYDPCAKTKKEAVILWNELNKQGGQNVTSN